MKRKHELERHNAEAKLQLFKMEQQEEAESALKDQQAALEGAHESKDSTDSDQKQLESIINSGRAQAMQVGETKDPPRKTDPAVEAIVKQKEGEVDNMKDKNCSNEDKVKEMLKPTKVESNLKKVLKEGLKEK